MREAPSTGLGSKQEQVIQKCSVSPFLSAASILTLSSKVGVALRGGQNPDISSPPSPLAETHTHTTMHTNAYSAHTHTGPCVVTRLWAPSQLQCHGHHLAHGQGFLSGSQLPGGF